MTEQTISTATTRAEASANNGGTRRKWITTISGVPGLLPIAAYGRDPAASFNAAALELALQTAELRQASNDGELKIAIETWSFLEMLRGHHPDFDNFQLSLCGADERFFTMSEHERQRDGENVYCILYSFFSEDGVYRHAPYESREWEVRIIGDNFNEARHVRRVLARVDVRDLLKTGDTVLERASTRVELVGSLPPLSPPPADVLPSLIELLFNRGRLLISLVSGPERTTVGSFVRSPESGIYVAAPFVPDV